MLVPFRVDLSSGGLTEINVEQGGVGAFHQDLLGRAMESLIHEVDTISDHGSDALSKTLRGPRNHVKARSSAWPGLLCPAQVRQPPRASPALAQFTLSRLS